MYDCVCCSIIISAKWLSENKRFWFSIFVTWHYIAVHRIWSAEAKITEKETKQQNGIGN